MVQKLEKLIFYFYLIYEIKNISFILSDKLRVEVPVFSVPRKTQPCLDDHKSDSEDEENPKCSGRSKSSDHSDHKGKASGGAEHAHDTNGNRKKKQMEIQRRRDLWVVERRPSRGSSWWCLQCDAFKDRRQRHASSSV